MKKLFAATAAALIASAGASFAGGHAVGACLITKTDTNPFFVKMKEGALAKAEELGVNLSTFAGKIDGDHETQVAASETCITNGAKGNCSQHQTRLRSFQRSSRPARLD